MIKKVRIGFVQTWRHLLSWLPNVKIFVKENSDPNHFFKLQGSWKVIAAFG